ncbi:putative transcription factor interactor and regulator CCHC(Zn) family [Helianthus annuus]|nr:putative transcription factor interactor and regulator CCHC(Zn) family [Helianthus annuus]
MNWVDDDPCECCGSGEHLIEDCSVFYEKVQAYKDREDYLSGLYEYRRADYEDFNGPSSHYPYARPPPPPTYQDYYYPEIDYHYEQERGYNNYEPDLPHFPSYQEEYDDYYHDSPQPTYEEPQDSLHSKLDAIMDMMIEMKKKDELRDN